MSEHRHEHRMEHDGPGWRAVLGYGRHFRDLWSSEVNQEIVRLAAPTEGEIALDIGAGMGAAVFVAADAVGEKGRVLAVEPTPFMRRTMTVRRWTSRHRRRVEILDGVAEHLPVTSDRVDVVWAVNVLHHMSDLGKAADELRRVMAAGGRVILVDEDFDDPAHPEHEQMKRRRGHAHHGGDHHHRTDGDGHHHLMVDVATLGETLAGRGFVEIDAGDRLVAGVPVRMVTASLPDSVR
jgi:SAM-dependent methyltransferase